MVVVVVVQYYPSWGPLVQLKTFEVRANYGAVNLQGNAAFAAWQCIVEQTTVKHTAAKMFHVEVPTMIGYRQN